jgi:hypothetical protein
MEVKQAKQKVAGALKSRDCWKLGWKREAVVSVVLSHMILLHAHVTAVMASTLQVWSADHILPTLEVEYDAAKRFDHKKFVHKR